MRAESRGGESSQTLLAQVRRTRRRALWLGSGRALLAAVAVLTAAPVVSTLVLVWLPQQWRAPAAGVWLAWCAGVALWLGRYEWLRARPRLSVAAASRLLAGDEDPRELITGVDLAAWGEGGALARGVSPELTVAQVARAASRAEALDPVAVLPSAMLWRWAGGVLLAGVLFLAWLQLNPGGTRSAWASLFLGGAPEPVTVGNLGLEVVPPAYTGLPTQHLEGIDGAVHAYPGSRVTLTGRLSRVLSSGQWEGPDGEAVALQLEGERFSVSWLVQRAGTYRLAFFEGRRPVASDFLPRPQSLEEDLRPVVTLRAPQGDLEVTSDQEVELAYGAVDDFQVERVELVASGDVEVRIPVAVEAGAKVEESARFLPLAHPELGAGAHLRLEAWDNDVVGGPKVGAGPSVYVAFLDKRRLLADIEGLQERLFEGLILYLGDHLEAGQTEASGSVPPSPQTLSERAGDLLALLDRLLEQVERSAEEGAVAALAVLRIADGLRTVLTPWAEGGGERGETVTELERDILFLDRLLQNLRMEQALSLGDELSALQRDLFDALQEDIPLQDLVEQVLRLQQLLAEMAAELSRGASTLPDSFANADAVEDMPASEMQQLLRDLAEALRSGDRETAQALAEKLLGEMSQWLAALEEAAGKASQGQLDPLLQELAGLEEDTSGLMADQEKLLGDTQNVGQRASARAAEALRQEMETFLQRQERRIQEVERQGREMETLAPRQGFHGLPRPQGPPSAPGSDSGPLQMLEARRRMGAAANELRSALREDLGRAKQATEALQQAAEDVANNVSGLLGDDAPRREAVQSAREAIDRNLGEILADLDAIGGRRLGSLGPEDREQLQRQQQRQGELAGRAGELAERLDQLAQKTPLLGPEAAESARGAKGSMQGAGGSLGQGDPFAAVPQQGSALEQLAELSQRLQGARQQMQQGMQGQGMQIVRSPGQRRPGGGQDVDRSRVEIPREMEARELRAFREDVLRAMRDGRYPEEYREDVERYYEGLIR